MEHAWIIGVDHWSDECASKVVVVYEVADKQCMLQWCCVAAIGLEVRFSTAARCSGSWKLVLHGYLRQLLYVKVVLLPCICDGALLMYAAGKSMHSGWTYGWTDSWKEEQYFGNVKGGGIKFKLKQEESYEKANSVATRPGSWMIIKLSGGCCFIQGSKRRRQGLVTSLSLIWR